MFDAMSFLISSIARRLRPRRRNKRITSSSAIRRPQFFSCGGGGGDSLISPFVQPKTLRKLKGATETSSKRIVGNGQDGRDGGKADVDVDADADESCVWRRTILLGQRCQPLEFNGAIHYDSEGRRLWQARTPPRSPLLNPAHSFEFRCMDRA